MPTRLSLRRFIKDRATASRATQAEDARSFQVKETLMRFELPPLPYPYDALEPHISRRTMEFHHQRHHGTYISKLNDLIEGTDYAKLSLEEIIRKSPARRGHQAVFNNAAQAWNHTFFWQSMNKHVEGEPVGELAARLRETFGSYGEFHNTFIQAAVNQFGSGWVWLVLDRNKLAVVGTHDAENPITEGKLPLLTCDVWEHAYYLDYQDRRKEFVEQFLKHLVNWDHVALRLEQAPKLEEVQ
jgi:Fe-Mn family superoxide dismutase